MTADETPDQDIGDVLIAQMFDLWIDEELVRRGTGLSRSDVVTALVELPPHGVPVVRINEEVSLAARASSASGITPGTPVTASNIDALEDVWPTNIGDDSGWTAFYLLCDSAHVSFDFRYDKGQANRLLDLAEDYLLTARGTHMASGTSATGSANLHAPEVGWNRGGVSGHYVL